MAARGFILFQLNPEIYDFLSHKHYFRWFPLMLKQHLYHALHKICFYEIILMAMNPSITRGAVGYTNTTDFLACTEIDINGSEISNCMYDLIMHIISGVPALRHLFVIPLTHQTTQMWLLRGNRLGEA
jgi:hypothetical protein